MKDNIQFLMILCLFAYIIFLQQCKTGANATDTTDYKNDTIVKLDTIFPPNIVIHLPKQDVPAPVYIYVDSFGREVPVSQIDTTKHIAASVYKDSVADENLTLFYTSMVQGRLLANSLNYKLKVPLQITKTVEVFKSVPVPVNQVLFNLGVGGKIGNYASVTVGAQFVSAKGWSAAYDYDLLQNAHSVKLGFRLFQIKGKRTT